MQKLFTTTKFKPGPIYHICIVCKKTKINEFSPLFAHKMCSKCARENNYIVPDRKEKITTKSIYQK